MDNLWANGNGDEANNVFRVDGNWIGGFWEFPMGAYVPEGEIAPPDVVQEQQNMEGALLLPQENVPQPPVLMDQFLAPAIPGQLVEPIPLVIQPQAPVFVPPPPAAVATHPPPPPAAASPPPAAAAPASPAASSSGNSSSDPSPPRPQPEHPPRPQAQLLACSGPGINPENPIRGYGIPWNEDLRQRVPEGGFTFRGSPGSRHPPGYLIPGHVDPQQLPPGYQVTGYIEGNGPGSFLDFPSHTLLDFYAAPDHLHIWGLNRRFSFEL